MAVVAFALATSACEGLVEIEGVGDVDLAVPVETSVVVAADGSVLAELHAEEDRDPVPLEDVPAVLQDAVVAVEDQRFWDHPGVDARALVRAVVQNIRQGRVAQGGSTITQQLAKNTLVGFDATLERKLEEASLALQIEAELSKEEILERYLNTVYLGGGAYGVQAAARRWFARDVRDVDLPRAALLAGMLRAPTSYDPLEHPQRARERRDLVLGLMAAQGLITGEERDAARAADLGVVDLRDEEPWRAAWFVDHVLNELQYAPQYHVLGTTPSERAATIYSAGLRIETTVDPVWQAEAEAAVDGVVGRPGDPHGAMAVLDPATGAIRALVGGRRYGDPADPVGRFNLATDGRRQPGSAFKPLVLAAALARGRTLEDPFPGGASVSLPVPGTGETWTVGNAGDRDLGPMTLRQATAWSVNVVYARLMAEVGPEAVVELARAAGVTAPLQPYLSLALGAQEVSVLDMATVAATLATGGIHREPSAVVRIVDRDGVVVWERPDPVGERVLDEEVAWQVTLALEEVVQRGTGVGANLQRPTAGKTGTSQDSADAWFTGFTPDMAAAVWVGFPEGRVPMVPPRTRITVEGGTWPAEIFARFGVRALADVPASGFPIPSSSLARVVVDTSRDCLPNAFTPVELIAERGYLAGTEPTEVCTEPTAPPQVDVPDVVGLRVEAARTAMQGAGLRVVERAQFDPTYPPGVVVAQDPAPGRGLTPASGLVVTLGVASADRSGTVVPDVLNLRLDEARAVLEAAGYVVAVDLTCPDGAASGCTGARQRPGTVWEQVPDAGARVPVHSSVVLRAYPAS